MRYFESQAVPIGKTGVFFTDAEFESIAIEELKKVSLLPKTPEPIRIEYFIEKRIGIVPEYIDLPENLLGATLFGKNGATTIQIAAALCENEKVAKRRLNTTLAHEAAHCLLHGPMFAMAEQKDASDQNFLCREETDSGAKIDPWEFQANRLMGALLMPKPLVIAALRKSGLAFEPSLEGNAEANRLLSETFDVNPYAAQVRIATLVVPMKPTN